MASIIAEQPDVTTFGDTGLDDTLNEMRTQMRRFAEAEVLPYAQEWHLKNTYIPSEVLHKLGELGVFALTLPEEFGGLGLGKEAMCVVSEELSRGYIGVGSLGTRSEIAAELILGAGTERAKTQIPAEGSPPGNCCQPRCSRNRTQAPTSPRSNARGARG